MFVFTFIARLREGISWLIAGLACKASWRSLGVLIMECEGLALQWEGSVEVRAHLRAHKQLVSHPETQKFCEATRQNCVDNKAILKPCLQSLHVTPGFRLPHLEPLKREITLLAEKVGLSLGEHGAYKPAVELKKLLGFIKRRAARKEVTKERVSKHLVVYLFFGNA